MYYINGKYNNTIETIDETETFKDAKYLVSEYRMAFGPEWEIYISQRSTKEWRERQ